MTPARETESEWLWGPLLHAAGRLPLALSVRWCDLRPRFLDKGRAGKGHRAIARNGRILLASPFALAELPGRVTRLRLQVWHKVILPAAAAEPYGILLSVYPERAPAKGPLYQAALERDPGEGSALYLTVGGGAVLTFRETGRGG
jgi:hypothetical protein